MLHVNEYIVRTMYVIATFTNSLPTKAGVFCGFQIISCLRILFSFRNSHTVSVSRPFRVFFQRFFSFCIDDNVGYTFTQLPKFLALSWSWTSYLNVQGHHCQTFLRLYCPFMFGRVQFCFVGRFVCVFGVFRTRISRCLWKTEIQTISDCILVVASYFDAWSQPPVHVWLGVLSAYFQTHVMTEEQYVPNILSQCRNMGPKKTRRVLVIFPTPFTFPYTVVKITL